MRPTRIAMALALLAMMLGLAACSGQTDLHEWVNQVKARKAVFKRLEPVEHLYTSAAVQWAGEIGPSVDTLRHELEAMCAP